MKRVTSAAGSRGRRESKRPIRSAVVRRENRETEVSDYLGTGRVHQKQRTRALFVGIAADLIKRGVPFTIADVADAAHVSRTTVYSYFPTLEMLLAQATLFMAGSIASEHVDELTRGDGSPEEKVDATIRASDEMVHEHEAIFRSVLRLSADDHDSGPNAPPRRSRFRPVWFTNAISELRGALGEVRFKRLVGALCLCSGIESTVVLQDICLMQASEASETKRWAAKLLIRGALAEAPKDRTRRGKKRAKCKGSEAVPS